MKKLIALAMAGVMSLALLAGCGNGNAAPSATAAAAATPHHGTNRRTLRRSGIPEPGIRSCRPAGLLPDGTCGRSAADSRPTAVPRSTGIRSPASASSPPKSTRNSSVIPESPTRDNSRSSRSSASVVRASK